MRRVVLLLLTAMALCCARPDAANATDGASSGRAISFSAVDVVGADTSDVEIVAQIFRHATGSRMGSEAVAAGLRGVVEFYVDRGRPFAQARIAAVDIRDEGSLTVEVIPGPHVNTGELRIEAARSRPELFARQAGWGRGLPLTGELIERTRAALATLPSLTSIDTATLIPASASVADLAFRVREAAAIGVAGMAGWIPKSGVRAGYWVGQGELHLLSPFRDGRSIYFRANRKDAYSREMTLAMWEPWPAGLPFWVGGEIRQRDYDSSFIETTATLTFGLGTAGLRWQVAGHWSKITPEEAPAADVFPSRRKGIGIAVADSGQNGSVTLSIDWTSHRLFARSNLLPPRSHLNHSQGRLAAWRALGISRATSIRLVSDAGGTLVRSDFIPPDLRFRVGGVYSLRGYNEEQFLADHFLRVATELHFGSARQSLFVFGDAGWLSIPERANRVMVSAGAGLQIARRLQLIMAVPGEGGFDQTKIHIALESGR